MRITLTKRSKRKFQSGALLTEAVIASAIFAMVIGTVLTGYVVASRQMMWASNSAAAQAMATRALEQAFGATWKPLSGVDEMVNLNAIQTDSTVLNGNATNYLTISNVLVGGPYLRMIKVDCIWSYRGTTYTNSIGALRAPTY